ncbi:GNAT family N-acetyltransferase [Microbacterium gorillae]|uniref:GNAT family N-acetyltransferase n=1 Tax=Microbacterium gorillae TaxID=1231063 RepID=UPI00058C83DC|nr:GNAT family N-acetyltransferase [Microbacterium gorillae]
MTVTYRTPGPADAAALADLHVGTWREAYSHLLPEEFFSDAWLAGRRKMWDHVLSHPQDDVTVLVAEQDGELVGFAWAGPAVDVGETASPRDRHLYAIYVRAAHYGTGIGQTLLDDTLGSGPAQLWVAKENPRAIRFYTRNGFTLDGTEMTDPSAPLITDRRMVR